LRIKDETYNFKNKMVSDQITPNTVYYYVFRFVNENGVHGPLSQIIQCELVDDGGYVYSLFDTVDSSEFNPNQVATNSVAFKKLIQFDPNIGQLYFDVQGVDFDDYAQNQIDNLKVGPEGQKIWDKKFKVRLTSKKTSKKIDLNLSYNLVERNLSKIDHVEKPPTDYMPEGVITAPELDDPPIVISYETGAGTVEPLPPLGAFGVASTADRDDIVDIDAGEYTGAPDATGGEIGEGWVSDEDGTSSYEPTSDGLVTESDLVTGYREAGLTTQGIGFPVTVYQLLAEPDYSFVDGTGGLLFDGVTGGFTFLRDLLAPEVYEPSDSSFTPEFDAGTAMHLLVTYVYTHRKDVTLVPMNQELVIASCMYLLQLIPAVHSKLYLTDITSAEWRPGGSKFAKYAAQIINTIYGTPAFSSEADYGDFEGSPYRPAEFSMSTLLSNLELDTGFFDSISGAYDAGALALYFGEL